MLSNGSSSYQHHLLVYNVGAKFHVHDGGRRLAELQKLADDKVIKTTLPGPHSFEEPDEVKDTSTAENLMRAAMHVADQFEAFATLRAKGRTKNQIATWLGIIPTTSYADA